MKLNALPIRYILLSAFLLVGLLPVVLMSVLAFNEAKRALKTEIVNDMQTQAKATASEVDRMMFERLQNVASWSQLEVMQEVRIGDVDKQLSNFLRELKESYRDVYLNLYIVNAQHTIISASDPSLIGQVYQEQADLFNIELPQARVAIAPRQDDRLPLLVPIQDVITLSNIGTLVVEFNWQQINTILDNAVSGNSAVVLFDQAHHLIAHSANWQEATTTHVIKVKSLTKHYVDLDWRLEIMQQKSEVMAPVRHMTQMFIALLFGSILLAGFIAWPVSRLITHHLAKLTAFVSQFLRSPNHQLPPIGGPTEVRDLASAFAKMIEDLEQSKLALTRAAKLAVAGEMAAAMSHEVRTPLGILRSSAQILLREPDISQEGKEVCGFIMSETERLNKLVSTLIDSAKPRTPVFNLIDLTQLSDEALSMMRMQADKKGVTLHFQYAGLMDVRAVNDAVLLACDKAQITQVLFNLIMNAVQILPTHGHVLLSIKVVDEMAKIVVADNGPGISAENLPLLFEPFFTQREGGVGLGLAVVRQIVEAHHGTIIVENGDQDSFMSGAIFTVSLPIVEKG